MQIIHKVTLINNITEKIITSSYTVKNETKEIQNSKNSNVNRAVCACLPFSEKFQLKFQPYEAFIAYTLIFTANFTVYAIK